MKLSNVDDVLAWLDAMPVADRVRTARLLADFKTAKAISAHADRVVYELTRQKSAAEVAKDLHTDLKPVRRAVERELAKRSPAAKAAAKAAKKATPAKAVRSSSA